MKTKLNITKAPVTPAALEAMFSRDIVPSDRSAEPQQKSRSAIWRLPLRFFCLALLTALLIPMTNSHAQYAPGGVYRGTLNGMWIQDGKEPAWISVEGELVKLSCRGYNTTGSFVGDRFHITVPAGGYNGTVSADGMMIRWSTGNVWTR